LASDSSIISSVWAVFSLGMTFWISAALVVEWQRRVIDKRGSYDGVEIFRPAVQWCDRHIHRRFNNFRFHHADVWNSAYNPKGKVLARNYTFPFPGALHDFVFLTSVFTHMLPPDMERYLAEISRVLKPGTHGLLTFFLLNDESLARASREV
jgi:SAM-dependent methyltransferase